MQAAVELLAREFSGVRTGRANTALLDAVRVEAYGVQTPINQMASLSVPDPKTLVTEITLDHTFLMSSHCCASEKAFATRALEDVTILLARPFDSNVDCRAGRSS